MGRSVFLLPRSDRGAIGEQKRRLREQLGPGGLKLEGPFSDKSESITGIAGQIREKIERSGERDIMESVMLNLRPLNLLHQGVNHSLLEVPFILVDECNPESAG